MSTRQQLINARPGMLALAEELQNISAACEKAGISRNHYAHSIHSGAFFQPS